MTLREKWSEGRKFKLFFDRSEKADIEYVWDRKGEKITWYRKEMERGIVTRYTTKRDLVRSLITTLSYTRGKVFVDKEIALYLGMSNDNGLFWKSMA